MGEVFYFGWEEPYLVWLQHLGGTGIFHTILLALNNFFSMFGEETACVAVMGLIYWGINKDKGLRIGLAVITANLSNGLIKNIFKRMRPYQALESVELLRDVGGYSFPSGHSANAASLYPTVAYEFRDKKWLKYIAVILPVLVAVSRNFLGAHWPTDVIAGLIQGIVIFTIIEFVSAKVSNKHVIYLVLLALCSVGIFYCRTDDYYNSYGMMIGLFFGMLFEEKFVRFENTKRLANILLRTAGGAILFAALNPAIKLVIGGLFDEGTAGYFLMRVVRYALVTFILIGVYPLAFRLEKKEKTPLS